MQTDRIFVEEIEPALTATEFSAGPDSFYLFVLYSGEATVTNDQGAFTAPAPSAFWSKVGLPAKIRLTAGSRGSLVRFASTQIQSVLPTGQVAAFVQRSVFDALRVDLAEAEDRAAARSMLALLRQAAQQKDPMSVEIVRSGVTQLLCHLLKSLALSETEQTVLPRRVVHEFCRLVDHNLTSHWTVSHYANVIGVTRDHLQSAVRRVLSKTPLEYIHSRLMDRSISLLRSSDLTVAEIAYRLGFSDAGYFSRFFKRHQGLAPGRFRKEAQQSSAFAPQEQAFSAWP